MKYPGVLLCLLVIASHLTLTPPLSVAREAAKEAYADHNIVRQLNEAFIEVAEKVSPAVVVIKVQQKPNYADLEDEDNPLFDMLPPQFRRQLEEQFQKERQQRKSPRRRREFDGQGSGVVIRESGFILTNRHVVDGAERIEVRFKDGTVYPAEVHGVDSQSDIAVIKINAKNLPVARLGDSAQTRVGEFAIAIGAPFNLDYSVTFGHVSAKGRHVIAGEEGAAMDQDFIQTDANINPGNSGGPLVNIDGEVIGINTLIRGLHTGIGFAIPINLAKEVSDQLITNRKFTRAWLGVVIQTLSDLEDKEMIKGVKEGVVVKVIPRDTPASKSGLRPFDVITAVDGKPVATSQQLKSEIRSKQIDSTVMLDVVRNGRDLKIKVKPEAWPEDLIAANNRERPAGGDSTQNLGLAVKVLTADLAKEFGVQATRGLIITAVQRGSPAEQNGIKPGDIITEIDHKPVTTPKQFRDAMKEADAKKGVIVNLVSRGDSKFEILKESGD